MTSEGFDIDCQISISKLNLTWTRIFYSDNFTPWSTTVLITN